MALRQLATGPALRELRVVTFADDALPIVARVPDATVSLMFRARRGGGADLSVLGPITRSRCKRAIRLDYTVRAILSPQAARTVLGVPLGELTDRVVALANVWARGADALLDRMASGSIDDGAHALAAAIAARVRPVTATDALVARARMLLEAGHTVAHVADELDVTERYLRRAFVDRTGLSPKRYARIARLQRVLARLRGRRPDWARLASELGYFDQAHLVNDFRDLTGATPDAFARPTRSRTAASPQHDAHT